MTANRIRALTPDDGRSNAPRVFDKAPRPGDVKSPVWMLTAAVLVLPFTAMVYVLVEIVR